MNATGRRDYPRFAAYLTAARGYFVLDVLTDDCGRPCAPIKYPVVAWALEEKSLVPHPVTLEGVGQEISYILQPDGSIDRPGIDGFASIDGWMADQIETWGRRTGNAVMP